MMALDLVANELVEGKITLEAACKRARSATGGEEKTLATGQKTRVLSSTTNVETQLTKLSAYVNRYAKDDVRRWAGTLLMVHAQLGTGLIHPDATPAVFGGVKSLVMRMINVSEGRCPAKAVPFALAIVDAVLEQCEDVNARSELFAARGSFAACAN